MFENLNYKKAFLISKGRFVFLLFFFITVGHSQTNDKANPEILAVIGNKKITVDAFITSYKDKLLRNGLTDNGDTRLKYLQNLIDDEVLITDAKNRRLDKTTDALSEYQRIRAQELLNAFSVKFIESEVKVTEEDIKSMYLKMNTKLKVRHLYAPSKEEADKLYSRVTNGESFEELAREVFRDPELRDNGGELGYITIDDMDPNFENAAFNLKVGEISKPVKTVTGYSIIQLEDIQQNPFVVESEYLKAHDHIKAFVHKRACEDAAKRYTKDEKNLLEIKFNEPLLKNLYKAFRWGANQSLLENTIALYQKNRNSIVVKSKFANWDLKTLSSEMQVTTNEQREWIHSETDLEDFISGLIIRKNTIKKALEAKLDNSASFISRVDFEFNSFLLKQVEQGLMGSIKISPDSVKSYYEQNSALFKKEPEMRLSSILVDNIALSDSVTRLLHDGISFELLAGQISIQKVTAKNKGDMGFFKKSELGNLGDQVFELKPDQWMGPISDEGKYLFLKCTEYKTSEQRSLSEVSKDIEKTLTTLSWYKTRAEYVNSLKMGMRVQVFPEKLNSLNLLTKADNR
ncbi:MAG: peptidylprolyl isomerase [Ignavibacteriaceae bacterium]|jgi:parvulin-like peptidyl-prolyl isomerase